MEKASEDKNVIPLFLKDLEGELHIISPRSEQIANIEKGWQLVYLGKPMSSSNV